MQSKRFFLKVKGLGGQGKGQRLGIVEKSLSQLGRYVNFGFYQ